MMNAIEFKDATFSFEGKTILHNLTAEIKQGMFVGLFGPNGAGKSTILRLILGLLRLDDGTLHVNGKPTLKGNSEIGYMPQVRRETQSFPLSGRTYLGITLLGRGWGVPRLTNTEHAQIDRVIELVGMQDYIERAVRSCSGGERQRLALAQALLGNPKILLLDEPLNNLDPHQQENIVNLVQSIQKQLDITVIFSGHDINPLIGIMDCVMYLGHGKAAIGSIDEVITSQKLSQLYDTNIEVIRTKENIWVMHKNTGCFNGHHNHK
jgi:zinc/manganese transport system ATP-binding protein